MRKICFGAKICVFALILFVGNSALYAEGAGSEQAFINHFTNRNTTLLNLQGDLTLTRPLGPRQYNLLIDGVNVSTTPFGRFTLTLLNNTLTYTPLAAAALNATIQNLIVAGASNTALLLNTAAGQTTTYTIANTAFVNNVGSAIRNIATGGTNVTNIWGTFSGNTGVRGGAIYNFAASGANSTLNIGDGSVFSGNRAEEGFAIFNDGWGIINLISDGTNSPDGIRFENNAGIIQGSDVRNDIFQAANATTNIDITNSGGDVFLDGGFAGGGTINMRGDTSGAGGTFFLAATSDNSNFTGTFNHFSGITNVFGTMFGGINNIHNMPAGVSAVNVFSGENNIYYNANLFSNATLNHFSLTQDTVTITQQTDGVSAGVGFMAGVSGAAVNFNNATNSGSSALANYFLRDNINNGLLNNVNFNFANVTLNPNVNYSGGTVHSFYNSVINLIDSSDSITQYSFGILNTQGSSLDFKILGTGNPFTGLLTDPGNFTTDSLLFSTTLGGSIDIGRLLISGDLVEPLGGTAQVLFNQGTDILQLGIAGGGSAMYVFSGDNMYQVGLGTTDTLNDSINIGLFVPPPGRDIDLNDFNAITLHSGISAGANRAWQIDAGTVIVPSVYYQPIHGPDPGDPQSDTTLGLGEMAAGIFSVHGTGSDIDAIQGTVLSGSFDEANPANRYSLFNMVNANTTFNLSDLTVSGAGINGVAGGSVLRLANAAAEANFSNIIIDNNIADGTGGAVNITDGTFNAFHADFTNNQSLSGGGALSISGGAVNIQGGLLSGISQNAGVDGGAIFQGGGTLNIANQLFSANTASASGGAIHIAASDETSIQDTVFSGNIAQGGGGAIFNQSANLIIGAGTAFTDNTAQTGFGGAINNTGAIEFDLSGNNIVFSGNTDSAGANDIFNDGIINITGDGGTMTLMGGVSGAGIINHDGSGIIGNFGDSSAFSGTFTQTDGITVNAGTFFGGTNVITGGTLFWINDADRGTVADKTSGSSLQISYANLVVDGNSTLRLNNAGDEINMSTVITLAEGSTISVEALGAMLALDAGDIWLGTVYLSEGTVRMRAIANVADSDFRQTGGTLYLSNTSILTLGGNAIIEGGDVRINSAAVHTNGTLLGWDNITLLATWEDPDNPGTFITPLINSIDGTIHAHHFSGNLVLENNATADFNIDIDAARAMSDSFNFDGIIDPGTINIQNVNLITAPRANQVDVEVFSAAGGIIGIDFTTTQDSIWTPVGFFSFAPILGQDGWYRLSMTNPYWPMVRPQAAKIAMLSSQLLANNVMFDHVFFDTNRMQRNVSRCSWRYLPNRFLDDDRNTARDFWVKTYFERQNIPVAVGYDMDNDIFGILTGIDFAVRDIGQNSYFMPTVYVGYNNARQSFSSASMNQNALQAGLMLSAVVNDVWTISSLTYVGAYSNQMSLRGNDDNAANNWFAGVALRNAYNFYLDSAILRPSLTLSYNYFGAQTVTSDHGALRMRTGALSGLNVSPRMDFIYTANNWNFLLGAAYNHNIGNRVTGRVGDIELPTIEYKQDHFEYTLGINRFFSDRFSAWIKCTVRTNDGNDFGVRLGAGWRL